MTQLLLPDENGVFVPSERHPVGLINQTNDEYHSGPGISKSHLDAIADQSPLHYWAKYLNPERKPKKPTADMILGSAIHSAILEPDLFPREYVTSPGFDRRTKNGKAEAEAFALEHAGKTVLEPEDWERCIAIRDRVHTHPEVAGLFMGGKAEQSFYAYSTEEIIDPETGEVIDPSEELIKCRFDYLHDSGEIAVDLKSTADASRAGFGKSIANFRYMLQPAWYYRVLKTLYGETPKAWVLVAVEKDPPYAIGYYRATPQQIERGRIASERLFARIIACRKSGLWPDYAAAEGLQDAELPAWAKY